MKKYILLAIAAVVALSGCVKDKETEFSENQVSFNATSGSLETRTYYGSETGNNQTFVNWKDGDEVTIMSTYTDGTNDGTGSRNPVNYTIENRVEGTVDSQEGIKISNAKIFPTDETSVIEWGAGTNVFYGMYPKSGTSGSSLSLHDGVPTMTCVIPASWKPSITVDRDELVELPYGYMFARTETARTTEVRMTFNPKFTAFYFTLKNDDTDNSIELTSLTLSSTSQALNGTFSVDTSSDAGTVSITNPNASESAAVQTANKSVTVNFPKGFSIPQKSGSTPGSRSFTVVVLPKAYPQLSQQEYEYLGLTNGDYFKELTVAVTNTANITKHLVLKRSGNWIPFAAGKKHNISITLPDFASYDYDFSVINPTDLTYAGGTAHASVVSTKKLAGGSAQSASWTVEGYYTDAACTTLASGYTSFLPYGIDNGSGGGNGDISFSYEEASLSAVSSNYQSVAEADIAASTFGSGSSTSKYLNLSNPTNMESDYIRESANSYIVNGVGYYKIPLVMGNGVKFNQANTAAYDGTNFINYKGTTVSSTGPYLHNTGSNPSAAYVVWEDVSGLIEADASYDLPDDPDDLDDDPIAVDGNGVYWLRFHVNQAKQGNAVIAVTDGTNVMWSYHIWVTNYIPQNYPGGGSADGSVYNTSYTVMPVNLGWVYDNSGSTSNVYPGACVYVKLRQFGGKEAVMKVERPRYSETTTTAANTDSPYGGYSPYYQWGRKDAFWPGTCPTNDAKGKNVTTYGKNPASASSTNTPGSGNSTSTSGIATSISNPHQFITASPWWGTSDKHDLWNKGQTSYLTSSSSTNKTIYDPCPVGYCIPCLDTFNNYTGTNTGTVVFKSLGIADQSGVYFHNCGYRDNSGNLISRFYSSTSGASYNFGMCALSGSYSRTYAYSLYFVNKTSAYTVTPQAHSYLNSAGYTVRPMQDPSFDPTDDGTTRGSGPNLDWVN